jgi:hypothetical protein
MDFRKNIVVPKQKSELITGVIVLKEDTFFVRVGDKDYEWEYDNKSINTNLYSLPNNDRHIDWTKRSVTKYNPKALEFWSILKPKLKVKGLIIDNIFKIIKL